ncbi:MAG TPA: glycosyltransferase family 2 protein [Usitatibacter sp.]|nr:glycosyltransferase family 2 protein [Usitatibacter sp.]
MNTGTVHPDRVSIVIPAYNSARTIGATLESCLAQRYDDLEIVVVNDGSTEEALPRVLASFGERIRVVNQPNGGVGAARNAGLRAASGELVAWIDSDDLARPDWIEVEAAVLHAYPDVVLVSSEFTAFTDSGGDIPGPHSGVYYRAVNALGGMARIYPEARPIPGGRGGGLRVGRVYESLVWGNFVHFGTSMGRAGVFRRLGGFDATLRYGTEWDMLIRMSRVGPFAFVEAPLLRYRRSESQLSHNASGGRMPLESIRVLEKVIRHDPDLHARHRDLFASRMARARVEAAEFLAPERRGEALRLLAEALPRRPQAGPWLHAFAKAVLPRPAIEAVRRIRQQSFRGRALPPASQKEVP